MKLWRRFRQWLCGVCRGHDPNIECVTNLFGDDFWRVICKKCRKVIRNL